MKELAASPRRTGRPLSFDRDVALTRAMHVFWRTGYETSSIADLTAAMGITPPSLYAAFGSKQQLFLEAVRLYAGDPLELQRSIEDAPTSRAAVETLLTGAAEAYTGADTPSGCLLASATASGSDASADVKRAVADIRRDVVRHLEARISRDIAEGALPATAQAGALARTVMAVMQGMSVLARDGSPRQDLLDVASSALAGWPDQPPPNR